MKIVLFVAVVVAIMVAICSPASALDISAVEMTISANSSVGTYVIPARPPIVIPPPIHRSSPDAPRVKIKPEVIILGLIGAAALAGLVTRKVIKWINSP